MSLTVVTLIPAALLILTGLLFLVNNSATVSLIRSFPRSRTAALVLFGGGSAWFISIVRGLSAADLILVQNPVWLMAFFGLLAVASFFYIPDFLAVRGLSVVILVGAWPLVMTAFGEYEHPQRLFMVGAVFLAIFLALYLGASPFRLRDFFDWLYRRPQRARLLGGAFLAYGLFLTGVAFTY